MNPAQTALYFREWSRARAYFVARGIEPKHADAKRHALHVAALGAAKSSKAFTNSDLDKVLGKFRAIHDSGNLDAQIHADESPEERRRETMERCLEVLGECARLGDERFVSRPVCEAYVAGTCRKVIGREAAECDAVDLAKVLGCLRAMQRRLTLKRPDIARNR